MFEKTERIIMLKDFYGPLLTQKQQDVLHLYYENDWSLSEIADNMGISRQAIYDLLKRSEKALEGYEERLSLLGRFSINREYLHQVSALLSSEGKLDPQAVQDALALLREIDDLI